MPIRNDPIFGLVAYCDDPCCSQSFGATQFTDDLDEFDEELVEEDWLRTYGDEAVYCPDHKKEHEYDDV